MDASTAANVARAIGNANPDLTNITVEIEVLDGATVEDERQIQLAVLATAPGGSDIDFVPDVVVYNGAGSNSVTLPTDFADYSTVRISILGTGGNASNEGSVDFPTERLTANRVIALPSTQNGSTTLVNYTHATRILVPSVCTITRVVLKNESGVKGDKGDRGDPGVGLTTAQANKLAGIATGAQVNRTRVRVANRAAYDALTNKVATTDYWWPEA